MKKKSSFELELYALTSPSWFRVRSTVGAVLQWISHVATHDSQHKDNERKLQQENGRMVTKAIEEQRAVADIVFQLSNRSSTHILYTPHPIHRINYLTPKQLHKRQHRSAIA